MRGLLPQPRRVPPHGATRRGPQERRVPGQLGYEPHDEGDDARLVGRDVHGHRLYGVHVPLDPVPVRELGVRGQRRHSPALPLQRIPRGAQDRVPPEQATAILDRVREVHSCPLDVV